jgi:N6-L-threonylcarbamoyladenine synthase
MRILGIESTCDETAAAVVEDGPVVRSSVVASQAEIHAIYRGVVPEIASRAHIENILPVIKQAVAEAGLALTDIDAIAVAYRPGLIGSLLIGVTAAKTLAWALGKPLAAVDHVRAHLYSVMLPKTANSDKTGCAPVSGPDIKSYVPFSFGDKGDVALYPQFPAVGLVCSGGHTALYRMDSWMDVSLIGSTIDDAVGEAYDKVAAILGLEYPGGPILDRLAASGNPKAIHFPRTLLERESLDFSFSGLKTSVLYHVRGDKGRERTVDALSELQRNDVAASFQAACIDVLIAKLRRAAAQMGAKSLIIGGGVSANGGLRDALLKESLPAFFPKREYCTDNAAMIAALGALLIQNGKTAALDLDAIPYSQFAIQK